MARVYTAGMADMTFAMGKFEARFPTDRVYSQHHMWLQDVGECYRVGLTDYSVRLLQDVYFLDWSLDPPATVRRRQEVGEVESSKAVSSLYAPVDGELLRFNDALMQSPELINTANYADGWLMEMQPAGELLPPQAYVKLLGEVWDQTQRVLQGQANAPEA